ncbi:MAG: helix-turn-helix domain-containing protein [Bacteroidota bacterium]
MSAEYDLSRSINLLSFFAIIGTFEGLFMGIFLLFKKSVKSEANFWLGILVLSITAILLPGAIYRLGLLPQLPHVVHVHMFTLLMMGPSAYLYVRSCTQKNFQRTNLMLLHFLPALFFLGYHLPFYLSSGDDKIASFFQFFLEGNIDYPLWVPLTKIIHCTVYFTICGRLVLHYQQHLSNTASYIDKDFHRWLLLFCSVLLMPLFSVLIFATTSYRLFSATTFYGGFFLFILAVHLAAMVKPNLFHPFPYQIVRITSEKAEKQKYESSKLQAAQKVAYLEKIQTHITTHKSYLINDLTLAQLSEQTNISTHYISQVINEQLDCNFLDFINSYRVEEAKLKLTDPKFSHYTISAIALESGFKARSTFYAAFKKHTGMTPSQYRKKDK